MGKGKGGSERCRGADREWAGEGSRRRPGSATKGTGRRRTGWPELAASALAGLPLQGQEQEGPGRRALWEELLGHKGEGLSGRAQAASCC